MASSYFDVANTDYGMTIRIYYEESNSVVSITKVQLKSTVYGGPTWYPDGTIKVNNATVLTMDYGSSATHAFSVYGAGDSWVDMYPLNGATGLPVKSNMITDTTSAVISVDIKLYRDSSTAQPTLKGSKTISIVSGFVYIDNGNGFEAYQCYIDNGSSWDLYVPYIDNGSGWDLYG